MTTPESPYPIKLPNSYSVRHGHLFWHDYDLVTLANQYFALDGIDDAPLTIRYMQRVRDNIAYARQAFANATKQTGYPAEVHIAYASKANPNYAMIRTALDAGVDYEASSRVDMSIVRHAIEQGWLPADRLVIANGFKTPGYIEALLNLARTGKPHVIPVFDSQLEIPPFINAGLNMEVGVRYSVRGRGDRFGMEDDEMRAAAQLLRSAPNLELVLFHAIQYYPAIENPTYIAWLGSALDMFKEIRQIHPSLRWFDVGGGLPAQLAEPDDLEEWMGSVQELVMSKLDREHVPNLVIESGRYTASAHQVSVFNVMRTKTVVERLYYVIGGGIMSNIPDAWGLGLEFPVAPVNYWDEPWQPVRLAGLTCDGDDVYPTQRDKFIMLPSKTDGLMVAFLDVGAYQDMLGGEGGAKHCLLSEGATVIIGQDPADPQRIDYYPPQTNQSVLYHLGYQMHSDQ